MVKVAVGLVAAVTVAAAVALVLWLDRNEDSATDQAADPTDQAADPSLDSEPEADDNPFAQPNEDDTAPTVTDPLPAEPATTSDSPPSESSTTSGPPPVLYFAPQVMAFVGGVAEVGLGPGRTFLYGECSQAGEFGCFEDPDEIDYAEAGEFDFQETTSAGCGFTAPLFIDLAEEEILDLDAALAAMQFEADSFSASFRFDQNNYVSIGSSGGVVAGGFSVGSEGRGNSEQWIIEGGAFTVDLLPTTYRFGGGEDDEVNAAVVNASWAGPSIENFTSEEGPGSVQITCVFLVEGLDRQFKQ